MHVPYTPDMVTDKDFTMPSMSLSSTVQAIKLAALTAVDTEEDLSLICGFAQ